MEEADLDNPHGGHSHGGGGGGFGGMSPEMMHMFMRQVGGKCQRMKERKYKKKKNNKKRKEEREGKEREKKRDGGSDALAKCIHIYWWFVVDQRNREEGRQTRNVT